MGRPRKIPMQKRDTMEKLSVTFTKRRTGLFHKAAELSRLCDAQVAVLVSAPNGKSYYAFSPTSVDAVLESFLGGRAPERMSDRVTREAHRLAGEIEVLEGALHRATEFRKAVGSGGGGCPWEALRNYEESVTTAEELRALHDCLFKLRAEYGPDASCSRTASNVVSPAVSERGDVTTAMASDCNGWCQEEDDSYDRTFLELDPIGLPQPGSSWMSWDEVGLECDSTVFSSDFGGSFWSDSNPNLEFLSPRN